MKLNIQNYEMNTGKDLKIKGTFVNRELSWLDFNMRVLDCSQKKDIPINERLNFLGITESNLDEFIGVRFSHAYNNKKTEPYKEILKKIKDFIKYQNKSFLLLKEEIEKKHHKKFVKPSNLNKKEKEKLMEAFTEEIFPLITPIDITSNDINLLTSTTYVASIIKTGSYEKLSVIPLIDDIDPIWEIGNKILFLEDIILYYLDKEIYINQNVQSSSVFRVVKDASVVLSHDNSKFIIERMEESVNLRINSKPLFIELRERTDELLENILTSIFKIPSHHIFKNKKAINYKIFMKYKILDESNSYKKFQPFNYENYENYYSLFEAIDNEDILLHHPYDSYDTVIKFLYHAAIDEKVVSIKQTLYRVSSINSPIVNSLCLAAKKGKHVTVLVEIKARFDEENNIHVIEKLKKHGVNVILGDEFLKTHCKMCLVTRRDEEGHLRVYSHIATGNYNEKTAKIYTDLSYFTSKSKIGIDLLRVFNILSGNSKPDESLNKVFYAPVNLRKQLEKCIDREIGFAKKGKKAYIFIKVNSISDERIVAKLYDAAKAGVKIEIICRGVCSIVPNNNIKIKSIVGRFLEHSRIYYFRNGGNEEYYISSADLLTRNLDRRVEILINLKDSNVINELKWIVSVMCRDEANSYIQKSNGAWVRSKGEFDAHQWMIDYSDIKKQKKKWKK